MDIGDPAAAYAALRDSTAAMFDYDLADLSLTQGLQIDLVSLLRLEVDTMQGKVLAGETVDLTRLVAAHGMLAKLLPERALVAPAPAAANPDFASAKEELNNFLIQRAAALEHCEQRESAQLREENARLREQVIQMQAQIRATPQPAAPAVKPPSNVVPIDGAARANATKPPVSYLREGQPREEWRSFVEGGRGEVEIACWSPPDERRR
jgi:hypothetical protein